MTVDDVKQPTDNNSALLASTIESVLPVEYLQLWHADKHVNMLSYVPQYCPKNQKVLLQGYHLWL